MNYQKLGKSDLEVSNWALGCMRMADKSVDEAAAVIETALELGVNFFDHADIYGGGESEKRFKAALDQLGVDREKLILQSKCGIREGYFDFSKEHILEAVDGSLERLGTDYLDVLLLHRPDALVEPEEVAEAFDELEQAGKVRYFGVSNQNPGQMALLQQTVEQPFVCNQLEFGPAHTLLVDHGLHVNMAGREGAFHDAGILEYCRLHDVTIQSWSPFQVDLEQGLIFNHPDYEALTQKLIDLGEKYGVSKEAMTIAFILRHPAKMQPIIGSMNPDRLRLIAEANAVDLTREEWYEIYRASGHTVP